MPNYPEKVCEKCGNLFKPRSPRTKYCDNCTSVKCVHCGELFSIRKYRKYPYCSKPECQKALRNEITFINVRKTNLERYGVEFPGANPESREKMKKTMIERYGRRSSNACKRD